MMNGTIIRRNPKKNDGETLEDEASNRNINMYNGTPQKDLRHGE